MDSHFINIKDINLSSRRNVICFDQRSKKREVDNLSSGWLWIAEPKVIVSFSDYVGDTNIWQNPGKQCKRPRRNSWASAKAIYLTSVLLLHKFNTNVRNDASQIYTNVCNDDENAKEALASWESPVLWRLPLL